MRAAWWIDFGLAFPPLCASRAKKSNQKRLEDKKRESSRKAERRSRDYD